MELKGFNYTLEIGWFDRRNASIARAHEYGTRKLKRRSHIFKALESQEFKDYINTEHGRKLLEDDVVKGLHDYAKLFIRYYKNFVLSGKVEPELSANTILRKKAKKSRYPNIPLVDTAQMINSITYKIEK